MAGTLTGTLAKCLLGGTLGTTWPLGSARIPVLSVRVSAKAKRGEA